MTRHAAEREGIVSAGRRTVGEGLNRGACGNLSVRVEGGFLVTPTGVPYEELTAGQIVEMRFDGSVAPGQLAPSSEEFFRALKEDRVAPFLLDNPEYVSKNG